MPNTTVFTAEVVTYNFIPETYAEAKSKVVAELNVNIQSDWKKALNEWYSGDYSKSSERTKKLYDNGTITSIDSKVQTLLTKSQTGQFMQTDRGVTAAGATSQVGSTTHGLDGGMDDSTAQTTIQHLLYLICDNANFWKSAGNMSTQLTQTLTTILGATSYNGGIGTETNKLIIDPAKVEADLGYNEPGDMPLNTISVTNQPTSTLASLVNGYAFVPVMNRLIAGGNFSRGTIDGSGDGDGAFRFDLVGNFTANGTPDAANGTVQIVFPIRIMFADDGLTIAETHTVGGETGSIAFQLNLIFSMVAAE